MTSRESVAEVLRNIKTLPTLPDVAARLLQVSDDEGASTRDMAVLIERDPSLAARVLKLVNSPYFGLRREITSVQQALVLLGTKQLRGLVLSGSLFDLFDQSGSVGSFSRKALWIHSVAVATVARDLARRTGVCEPEPAFTAGLIHDIGKVIIDRFLREQFVEVVQKVEAQDCTMAEAERDVLGIDHAQVGAHFALYWNLPEMLRDAVGYHHNPEAAETSPALASLIAVSDVLARELKVGAGGGRDNGVRVEDLERLGLERMDYVEIRHSQADRLEEEVGMVTGS